MASRCLPSSAWTTTWWTMSECNYGNWLCDQVSCAYAQPTENGDRCYDENSSQEQPELQFMETLGGLFVGLCAPSRFPSHNQRAACTGSGEPTQLFDDQFRWTDVVIFHRFAYMAMTVCSWVENSQSLRVLDPLAGYSVSVILLRLRHQAVR